MRRDARFDGGFSISRDRVDSMRQRRQQRSQTTQPARTREAGAQAAGNPLQWCQVSVPTALVRIGRMARDVRVASRSRMNEGAIMVVIERRVWKGRGRVASDGRSRVAPEPWKCGRLGAGGAACQASFLWPSTCRAPSICRITTRPKGRSCVLFSVHTGLYRESGNSDNSRPSHSLPLLREAPTKQGIPKINLFFLLHMPEDTTALPAVILNHQETTASTTILIGTQSLQIHPFPHADHPTARDA